MTLYKRLVMSSILLVGLAVTISTTLTVTGQTRVLSDKLIGEGRLMARQIALSTGEAFRSLNWLSVESAIQNVASAEDVMFCKVVMPDGTVYLADDREYYGESIAPEVLNAGSSLIEDYVDRRTGRPGTLIVEQIEVGQERWWVLLALSSEGVNEAARSVLLNNLLAAIAIMVPAIAGALVLSKGISGPIVELANAAKSFASGRLDHAIDTRATGEVGALAASFNEMVQELRASQEQLEDYGKGLEEALVSAQESEIRARALADNALDGIYMVQDDRYIYCNQALADMLGYTADEIRALEDRTELMADTPLGKPLVYERYRARLRGENPPSQYEAQLVKKGGKTVVEVVLASSAIELDGKPASIVLIKDITERKRAEEALRRAHDELEIRVEERTADLARANEALQAEIAERKRLLADLERRALQLQTTTELSRAASSILDVDELLNTSVSLIRDRFDLYYAGLFLVDEAGKFAVLRAGSGEAGRQMLEQGHRLEIGGSSMIGWCVSNKQARIALDVGQEAMRFENPLLPEARSELALPLISRGQAIGALTIQSTQEAAFSEDDIVVLQTMADPLANAIANARLFGLTEQARAETDKRVRELDCLNDIGHRMSASPPVPELLSWVTERIPLAMEYPPHCVVTIEYQGRTFGLSEGKVLPRQMVQSLHAGNGDVGRIYIAYTTEEYDFLDEESALLGDIARRLSSYIESRRLFQEIQANLQEITSLHRIHLQEHWQEFLTDEEARQRAGYLFDQQEVQPAGDLWRPEIEMAVAQGRTLALTADSEEWPDGDTRAALVVPLQLRDQVIGVLDLFETDQDRQWSEDDIALVEAIADQLALAVENARAYEELQRTAVQLEEMDRLKSQFLANMSHELRTPLNSIIGFSRVLLKGIDGPLTDLQKADLTSIYNNGQNLLGLINDVLDMSRIEAGKMELVFEPVDLRPIIDGVMSTAIALVKEKPVELVKEVADDLPIIRADSTRIRQVILNLVSNAANFTEEGSITTRAWVGDDCVTVSVTDNGIGIPEDQWEKIFEEFQQVDGSTTRRVSGSGLGLPISRHFVEMHGGRIWVESEIGVGSTFTFTIPIHGPGYVEDPELTALEIDPNRRLVLAVEGDEGIITIYRRHLERHGYQIVGLTDAERVQLWVRELSPFVILIDVMLPEADGWEVLEKLKVSRETAHVPVIICSIAREEARGLSLGAVAYLTKPVLGEELLQAMTLAAKLQTT